MNDLDRSRLPPPWTARFPPGFSRQWFSRFKAVHGQFERLQLAAPRMAGQSRPGERCRE